MNLLNDSNRLKECLKNIEKIEKDSNYDKKYFYFNRDLSTRSEMNFRVFKLDYYAGRFGSSSVSGQLPILNESSKRLFEDFLFAKIPSILVEFSEFLSKAANEERLATIASLEKQLEELKGETNE